jgi:hypothetical protein
VEQEELVLAPIRRLGWIAQVAALALLLSAPAAAGKKRPHAPRKPRPAEREDEVARERGMAKRRRAWWLLQRGAIPDGAYAEARRAFAELGVRARGGAGGVHDATPPWVELGPAPLAPPPQTPNSGPITGRMRAVVVHPTDPRTIYAGAAQGGVWKSSDGGASWKALTDGQPSPAVGAIALDPAAPETVYVGTGESTFGFFGAGVLKSTDGGQSWSRPAADQFAGAAIDRIVVAGGAIYLAATAGSAGRGSYCTSYYDKSKWMGLWRSADGGTSWTQLAGGPLFDLQVDASRVAGALLLDRR